MYYKMPNYRVDNYTNTIPDLFDEKRWLPGRRSKNIHQILKPYIKKYRNADGKILRTRGDDASKDLARKIFERLMVLVKEDMIENNDFFELPCKDLFGMKIVYDFNPDSLNRKYVTYYQQTMTTHRKVRNEYVFIFDKDGAARLRAKLSIHGNRYSFGPNHYRHAYGNPQVYNYRRDRYRELVWGMRGGDRGIYGNDKVSWGETDDQEQQSGTSV